jgi:hypothetical protein
MPVLKNEKPGPFPARTAADLKFDAWPQRNAAAALRQFSQPFTVTKALYSLVVFLLIVRVLALTNFSWWAIGYPFEMDYGEGVVWQQMRLITSGRAFGDFGNFPAIANNYPPVYHLLTAALSSVTGADPLAAGRAISFGALIAAAWLAGKIINTLAAAEYGRTAARFGALVGALLLFSISPISFWTPVMRVDMLALAFSLGGMYLSFRALDRPALIYSAAILFVLGLYTKQTMLAAPAASFAVLHLVSPKTALKGSAACLAIGGLILAGLCWATDGGFARHIFGANINRFSPELLLIVPLQVLTHFLLIGLALLSVRERSAMLIRELKDGGIPGFRQHLQSSPTSAMTLVLLIYFALATIMLASIAKSGSNLNYMIEWFFIVAILVGLWVAGAARSVETGQRKPAYVAFIMGALAIQVIVMPHYRTESETESQMAELSTLVRTAKKPIISDDMVLLLRSGKEVLVEPGYVAELSALGIYDNSSYIQRINNGDFAFFVTQGERGERMFDSRYSPDVAEAIYEAYPRKRVIAGLTLHLPRRSR